MGQIKFYALAIFGVVAGQFLRMGQKISQGKPLAMADLLVMFSLLPAYGGLVGAAGAHFGWSVLMIVAVAICAGWLGFGAMHTVLALVRGNLPKAD